jgi:ISXO2-like transposase domain
MDDEYSHNVVNHLDLEAYVDGNIHTNGLENFWSLLKRSINGTYVSVEPFHLFRYVDEQAFRYNNRLPMSDADRFSFLDQRSVDQRGCVTDPVAAGPDRIGGGSVEGQIAGSVDRVIHVARNQSGNRQRGLKRDRSSADVLVAGVFYGRIGGVQSGGTRPLVAVDDHEAAIWLVARTEAACSCAVTAPCGIFEERAMFCWD